MQLNTLFLIMITTSEGKYRPNWTRIVEGLLIAAITALFTSQLTLAKLQVKMDFADQERKRIEDRVERVEDCMIKLLTEISKKK